jgi:hypothetical protein
VALPTPFLRSATKTSATFREYRVTFIANDAALSRNAFFIEIYAAARRHNHPVALTGRASKSVKIPVYPAKLVRIALNY